MPERRFPRGRRSPSRSRSGPSVSGSRPARPPPPVRGRAGPGQRSARPRGIQGAARRCIVPGGDRRRTRKRQARPSAWWAGAHTWPPWISRPDCTPRPWLEKRATASRFVWTSCCLGGKSGRACSIGSIFPPRAWWRSPWTKREPSGGGEPEGGLMEKRYLALLEGELTEERLMRQRLVLKGRERVLVELADHADFRRHTLLRPLAALDARELADILEAAEGRVWRARDRRRAATLPPAASSRARDIRSGRTRRPRVFLCGATAVTAPPGCAGWSGRTEARGPPRTRRTSAFTWHHGCLSLPGWTVRSAPRWLDLLGGVARAAGLAWLEERAPAPAK